MAVVAEHVMATDISVDDIPRPPTAERRREEARGAGLRTDTARRARRTSGSASCSTSRARRRAPAPWPAMTRSTAVGAHGDRRPGAAQRAGPPRDCSSTPDPAQRSHRGLGRRRAPDGAGRARPSTRVELSMRMRGHLELADGQRRAARPGRRGNCRRRVSGRWRSTTAQIDDFAPSVTSFPTLTSKLVAVVPLIWTLPADSDHAARASDGVLRATRRELARPESADAMRSGARARRASLPQCRSGGAAIRRRVGFPPGGWHAASRRGKRSPSCESVSSGPPGTRRRPRGSPCEVRSSVLPRAHRARRASREDLLLVRRRDRSACAS